jgi:5'-nucleotidase
MMNILISNDDGVYALGIEVLAEVLSEMGKIHVFAPDRNRSGASNSLTLENPLRAKKLANGFVSIEGTPTDCVHLALTGFLRNELPDIVVSGINAGANLGDDILYSGTVAAAREGRFLNLPSIAVSLAGDVTREFKHYKTAAIFTKIFLTHLKKQSPRVVGTPNILFNVNVPDLPIDQIKGVEMTRLGTRFCSEPTIKEQDPRGKTIYWVGLPGPAQEAGPGTDFYAIQQGKISVTPLRLDLTNTEILNQISPWANELQF